MPAENSNPATTSATFSACSRHMVSLVLLIAHDCVRLDLDQPIGVDKAHYLHDGIGRADAAKELSVDSRDPVPVLYPRQQNSGAGRIRKLAAQSFNGGLDYFKTSSRLTCCIALRDCLAVLWIAVPSRNCDDVPGSHGSRNTDLRLEWRRGR